MSSTTQENNNQQHISSMPSSSSRKPDYKNLIVVSTSSCHNHSAQTPTSLLFTSTARNSATVTAVNTTTVTTNNTNQITKDDDMAVDRGNHQQSIASSQQKLQQQQQQQRKNQQHQPPQHHREHYLPLHYYSSLPANKNKNNNHKIDNDKKKKEKTDDNVTTITIANQTSSLVDRLRERVFRADPTMHEHYIQTRMAASSVTNCDKKSRNNKNNSVSGKEPKTWRILTEEVTCVDEDGEDAHYFLTEQLMSDVTSRMMESMSMMMTSSSAVNHNNKQQHQNDKSNNNNNINTLMNSETNNNDNNNNNPTASQPQGHPPCSASSLPNTDTTLIPRSNQHQHQNYEKLDKNYLEQALSRVFKARRLILERFGNTLGSAFHFTKKKQEIEQLLHDADKSNNKNVGSNQQQQEEEKVNNNKQHNDENEAEGDNNNTENNKNNNNNNNDGDDDQNNHHAVQNSGIHYRNKRGDLDATDQGSPMLESMDLDNVGGGGIGRGMAAGAMYQNKKQKEQREKESMKSGDRIGGGANANDENDHPSVKSVREKLQRVHAKFSENASSSNDNSNNNNDAAATTTDEDPYDIRSTSCRYIPSGQYLLHQLIGKGAYGQTWLVEYVPQEHVSVNIPQNARDTLFKMGSSSSACCPSGSNANTMNATTSFNDNNNNHDIQGSIVNDAHAANDETQLENKDAPATAATTTTSQQNQEKMSADDGFNPHHQPSFAPEVKNQTHSRVGGICRAEIKTGNGTSISAIIARTPSSVRKAQQQRNSSSKSPSNPGGGAFSNAVVAHHHSSSKVSSATMFATPNGANHHYQQHQHHRSHSLKRDHDLAITDDNTTADASDRNLTEPQSPAELLPTTTSDADGPQHHQVVVPRNIKKSNKKKDPQSVRGGSSSSATSSARKMSPPSDRENANANNDYNTKIFDPDALFTVAKAPVVAVSNLHHRNLHRQFCHLCGYGHQCMHVLSPDVLGAVAPYDTTIAKGGGRAAELRAQTSKDNVFTIADHLDGTTTERRLQRQKRRQAKKRGTSTGGSSRSVAETTSRSESRKHSFSSAGSEAGLKRLSRKTSRSHHSRHASAKDLKQQYKESKNNHVASAIRHPDEDSEGPNSRSVHREKHNHQNSNNVAPAGLHELTEIDGANSANRSNNNNNIIAVGKDDVHHQNHKKQAFINSKVEVHQLANSSSNSSSDDREEDSALFSSQEGSNNDDDDDEQQHDDEFEPETFETKERARKPDHEIFRMNNNKKNKESNNTDNSKSNNIRSSTNNNNDHSKTQKPPTAAFHRQNANAEEDVSNELSGDRSTREEKTKIAADQNNNERIKTHLLSMPPNTTNTNKTNERNSGGGSRGGSGDRIVIRKTATPSRNNSNSGGGGRNSGSAGLTKKKDEDDARNNNEDAQFTTLSPEDLEERKRKQQQIIFEKEQLRQRQLFEHREKFLERRTIHGPGEVSVLASTRKQIKLEGGKEIPFDAVYVCKIVTRDPMVDYLDRERQKKRQETSARRQKRKARRAELKKKLLILGEKNDNNNDGDAEDSSNHQKQQKQQQLAELQLVASYHAKGDDEYISDHTTSEEEEEDDDEKNDGNHNSTSRQRANELIKRQAHRGAFRDTLDELAVLSNCAHPCILAYVESFVQNSKLHIVTEYMDSSDLAAEIKKRRASTAKSRFFLEETILFILVQILLGLEYLHRHNILHRDLKSANILLSRMWLVKLADFGLAKQFTHLDVAANSINNRGGDVDDNVSRERLGTPMNMSPELFAGKPYSEKADMWALGITLYSMITLRNPFEGVNDLKKLQKLVANGLIPEITRTDISQELKNVCYSLLRVDPRKRPSAKKLLTSSTIVNDAFESFVTKYQRIARNSHSLLDAKWSQVLQYHYDLLEGETKTFGAGVSSTKARQSTKSVASKRERSKMNATIAAASARMESQSRANNAAGAESSRNYA